MPWPHDMIGAVMNVEKRVRAWVLASLACGPATGCDLPPKSLGHGGHPYVADVTLALTILAMSMVSYLLVVMAMLVVSMVVVAMLVM